MVAAERQRLNFTDSKSEGLVSQTAENLNLEKCIWIGKARRL